MKHRTPANKPATATLDVPAFDPAEAFNAFSSLALSRESVKLESANYSDASGYRSDRRTIEKQTARLRAALSGFWADVKPFHQPEDAARIDANRRTAGLLLIAASISERFTFAPDRLAWEYCAGQYYPVEIRGAAARVAEAALKHLPAPKDYDGARYEVQRLGWVVKSAARTLNDMLKGIARCNGLPSGYYAPKNNRRRSLCLLSFARVLHAEIVADVERALLRPDAPALDPDGLNTLVRIALNFLKDAERVAALAHDPFPDYVPGAALADHARKLYPNPDAQDVGIYA